MAKYGYGKDRVRGIYPELENYLDSHGLSLQEFSEKSGVSIACLGNALKGTVQPSMETVNKLCRATGLTFVLTPDGSDFVWKVSFPTKEASWKEKAEEKARQEMQEVQLQQTPAKVEAVSKEISNAAGDILAELRRQMGSAMTIADFQKEVAKGMSPEDLQSAEMRSVFGLCSSIGALQGIYGRKARASQETEAMGDVRNILSLLAVYCIARGWDLEDIARNA